MDVVDGKAEMPVEWIPDDEKLRETSPDWELKRNVLDLFETTMCTTLSEAATKLGLSKYKVYKWKRDDSEFVAELQIAKELVADQLEQELLKAEKMAEVTARIFLLNGLRPGTYKGTNISIENPRLEKLLEEITKAGKKRKDAPAPSGNSDES